MVRHMRSFITHVIILQYLSVILHTFYVRPYAEIHNAFRLQRLDIHLSHITATNQVPKDIFI